MTVDAKPCSIIEFFNGTKQMVVPLFQRPYEWTKTHWETLWNDLLEVYAHADDASAISHFTGAIVTAPAKSVPVGVSKHLVIDGQQRLTTLTILLSALRSLREPKTPKHNKLTKLLVNEDDEGLDRYKLLPTQPDRQSFFALIDSAPEPTSTFGKAHQYFRERMQGVDLDDAPIDLDRLTAALNGGLVVVSIHLSDADDPYLIFESLNAKGASLTQADLIRNYVLFKIPQDEQEQVYSELWLPMQQKLDTPELTEFMRQYLMQDGEEVSKSSIYGTLKKKLIDAKGVSVKERMRDLAASADRYAWIIGKHSTGEASITKALARLRRWEISVTNPVILKILGLCHDEKVATVEVVDVLRIMESFAVRRAVCSVPTNQLKKIFLGIAKDMPATDLPAWLRQNLAAGSAGRRWPKDEEFAEGLLLYRAYGQVDRCKFILESLEDAHEHLEAVGYSNATIEHVMPRTLTDAWKTALGPTYNDVHERWLDVLGNLTLTAYNASLSNDAFEAKQPKFAQSHYELNKHIAAQPTWGEAQIRERTKVLFDLAKDVWARVSG